MRQFSLNQFTPATEPCIPKRGCEPLRVFTRGQLCLSLFAFVHNTPFCLRTMAQRTVHIGNLASSVSEELLRKYLAMCGQITNVKLAGDPNFPARFAFIEFSTPSGAQYACTHLNGVELDGKSLKIQMAKNAISTPPTVNSSPRINNNSSILHAPRIIVQPVRVFFFKNLAISFLPLYLFILCFLSNFSHYSLEER